MVYMNFVCRTLGNLDDAEASTSGQLQAELEDNSTECVVSEGRLAYNFVQNEGVELW